MPEIYKIIDVAINTFRHLFLMVFILIKQHY